VIAELFVKIINDFRHLLALLIVVIFALVLGYGLIRAGKDLENITKVLQVVVSTLGGLIGSIIGYYFGESAGRRASNREIERESELDELEQKLESGEEAITPAPPPVEETDSQERTSG
jgi:membrane protein DedA with SNARE-associated domain